MSMNFQGPVNDEAFAKILETFGHPMTTQRLKLRVKLLLTALLMSVAVALVYSAAHAQTARTARTATITFTRPVTYTDGSVLPASLSVSYKVYQGAKGSTSKTVIGTITSTATTVSTGLQPGETCWQVSALANGVESALSNEGCKTFAFPATDVVTITVT